LSREPGIGANATRQQYIDEMPNGKTGHRVGERGPGRMQERSLNFNDNKPRGPGFDLSATAEGGKHQTTELGMAAEPLMHHLLSTPMQINERRDAWCACRRVDQWMGGSMYGRVVLCVDIFMDGRGWRDAGTPRLLTTHSTALGLFQRITIIDCLQYSSIPSLMYRAINDTSLSSLPRKRRCPRVSHHSALASGLVVLATSGPKLPKSDIPLPPTDIYCQPNPYSSTLLFRRVAHKLSIDSCQRSFQSGT